jgi:hypothetical protein
MRIDIDPAAVEFARIPSKKYRLPDQPWRRRIAI